MKLLYWFCGLLLMSSPVSGQDSFSKVADAVNGKLVKLYGAGGFRGAVSYGTGIVVSADGYILTSATQLLDTQELRVHLSDGRRYIAKTVVIEPELDLALVKIQDREGGTAILNLDFFDVPQSAKLEAKPGEWALGFSNCFQIASRDESLTIQRATVAARAKLVARRGVFEVPFNGEVYFLDAITNNPGAAGGALTTQTGQLLGVIGKEFRNVQSDTWINYAIPLNCKVELKDGDKTETISVVDFVTQGMAGKWKPRQKKDARKGPGGYHGIVFVPNVVEKTPAYIEGVEPGSPAAKAGLRPDDLLVYVDGEPVYSIKSFREMMTRTQPGSEVRLEIRRGDRLTSIDLKMAEQPGKK